MEVIKKTKQKEKVQGWKMACNGRDNFLFSLQNNTVPFQYLGLINVLMWFIRQKIFTVNCKKHGFTL